MHALLSLGPLYAVVDTLHLRTIMLQTKHNPYTPEFPSEPYSLLGQHSRFLSTCRPRPFTTMSSDSQASSQNAFVHRKKIRLNNSNIRPPKTTNPSSTVRLSAIVPRFADLPLDCFCHPISRLLLPFYAEGRGRRGQRTKPHRTNRALEILLLARQHVARRLASLGRLVFRVLEVGFALLGSLRLCSC